MRRIGEAIRHGIELWFAQMKESVERFDDADDIWSDPARVLNCDETAFVLDRYSGRADDEDDGDATIEDDANWMIAIS